LVTDFSDPNNEDVPSTLAVETKIDSEIVAQIPNALPTMFKNVGGFMELATVYKRPVTNAINFASSGLIGLPTLPVYDTFTITESALVDANRKNQWEIFFSCETVPAIISSPASYMDITGTILTGYVNLNRITFLLDYVYNETTDLNELKVIVNIYQQPNANEDVVPPPIEDSRLLVHLKYDENESPAPVTLTNHSVNSADYVVEFVNNTDGTYISQGGGRYSLKYIVASSGGDRGRLRMPIELDAANKITTQFTWIAVLQLELIASPATRMLIGNNDDTVNTGFRISYRPQETNKLRVKILDQNMDFNSVMQENNTKYGIAVSFDGTDVNVYAVSPANSISFGLVGTSALASGKSPASNNTIRWDELNVGSTPVRSRESYEEMLYNEALSAAEIEDLLDTMML
jgi:hypothetical protein